MTAIDHSGKQVFTYFIHWSPHLLYFGMHLSSKWIYGVQTVYILKDACRVWSKMAKILDGR